MNLEHGIYQVSNLEIRQAGPQGSGAGRSITGNFGYSPEGSLRRMATVKNSGRDRKEMVESGAFNFSISTIIRLKAEYDELFKQGAQKEILEVKKQELARRDIHILHGHNWNRVLGSAAAGSAFIDEVLDDPEDPHISFNIPLPKDESVLPTYYQDLLKEIELGLAVGVSPGFFMPPKEKVPDAVGYIDEPGSKEGRGGSVSLNSLQAIDKWISALVMPLPGLAWAGCHRLDRAFARQAMNVVGAGCRTPDNDQDRDAPPRRFGRPGDRLPRI